MHSLDRRRLLGTVASAALVGAAGCGGDGTDDVDPADRGPLAVSEFAFAADRPTAYGEYAPQPDDTYAPGDTVWLYAELDGVAGEPVDDGEVVRIDLRQHVTVEGPDGDALRSQTDAHDDRFEPETLERFYATTDVGLGPAVDAGSYDVAVTFTDAISGTEADATGSFQVED